VSAFASRLRCVALRALHGAALSHVERCALRLCCFATVTAAVVCVISSFPFDFYR